MRTRKQAGILSLLLAALLATPALAGGAADEATLDILVDTIQADRKALVAVNLGLDGRRGNEVLAGLRSLSEGPRDPERSTGRDHPGLLGEFPRP